MPNSSLSETKLVAVSSASNLEKSHRELSCPCLCSRCSPSTCMERFTSATLFLPQLPKAGWLHRESFPLEFQRRAENASTSVAHGLRFPREHRLPQMEGNSSAGETADSWNPCWELRLCRSHVSRRQNAAPASPRSWGNCGFFSSGTWPTSTVLSYLSGLPAVRKYPDWRWSHRSLQCKIQWIRAGWCFVEL
ncbi:hypothetical protein BDW62DRAFT_129877 [Aspergillus aurantiobrunneus]